MVRQTSTLLKHRQTYSTAPRPRSGIGTSVGSRYIATEDMWKQLCRTNRIVTYVFSTDAPFEPHEAILSDLETLPDLIEEELGIAVPSGTFIVIGGGEFHQFLGVGNGFLDPPKFQTTARRRSRYPTFSATVKESDSFRSAYTCVPSARECPSRTWAASSPNFLRTSVANACRN